MSCSSLVNCSTKIYKRQQGLDIDASSSPSLHSNYYRHSYLSLSKSNIKATQPIYNPQSTSSASQLLHQASIMPCIHHIGCGGCCCGPEIVIVQAPHHHHCTFCPGVSRCIHTGESLRPRLLRSGSTFDDSSDEDSSDDDLDSPLTPRYRPLTAGSGSRVETNRSQAVRPLTTRASSRAPTVANAAPLALPAPPPGANRTSAGAPTYRQHTRRTSDTGRGDATRSGTTIRQAAPAAFSSHTETVRSASGASSHIEVIERCNPGSPSSSRAPTSSGTRAPTRAPTRSDTYAPSSDHHSRSDRTVRETRNDSRAPTTNHHDSRTLTRSDTRAQTSTHAPSRSETVTREPTARHESGTRASEYSSRPPASRTVTFKEPTHHESKPAGTQHDSRAPTLAHQTARSETVRDSRAPTSAGHAPSRQDSRAPTRAPTRK